MDRFRDLERAGETGRKDAALLAAIAGFEALKHPTCHDLRQFSNLFIGLFSLTAENTRRTAAAAMSKFPALPQEVCMIVADQPIRISAPFLALNPGISDPVLLQTITRHAGAHARAISRRTKLSPQVIDALAEVEDAAVARSLRLRHGVDNRVPAMSPEALARRRQDDDRLRDRIRDMALTGMKQPQAPGPAPTPSGRPDHVQLTRYAQSSEQTRFRTLLARALGADEALAERILMDSSGTQLAMALQSLNMSDTQILGALVSTFPELQEKTGGVRHADMVLHSVDRADSAQRVAAWVRANASQSRGNHILYEPFNNNSDNISRPVPDREAPVVRIITPAGSLKQA